MSELFKSKVEERRGCKYIILNETIFTFLAILGVAVVCLGAFALYGYHVVEVEGSAIPANRAVKSWEKAEIVKTEHLTGQGIVGLGSTGRSTGVIAARSLEENSIYYILPAVGDGRKIYKADVDYQFLLEAERAKGFEVQVRTHIKKKNFLVDESIVRPLTVAR
ncbi:TPA: hypothetical protein ACQZK0_004892 [Enterobacter mori]